MFKTLETLNPLPQDAAALAEAQAPAVPAGAGAAAGQIALNPKITPMLPPPSPGGATTPVSAFSNCSGYITHDEIMAGLEYAAGKEYMPFDQWCAGSQPLKYPNCMARKTCPLTSGAQRLCCARAAISTEVPIALWHAKQANSERPLPPTAQTSTGDTETLSGTLRHAFMAITTLRTLCFLLWSAISQLQARNLNRLLGKHGMLHVHAAGTSGWRPSRTTTAALGL